MWLPSDTTQVAFQIDDERQAEIDAQLEAGHHTQPQNDEDAALAATGIESLPAPDLGW